MSLYDKAQKSHKKCEEFLAQVDRIEAEIAAGTDMKCLQKLQREKPTFTVSSPPIFRTSLIFL